MKHSKLRLLYLCLLDNLVLDCASVCVGDFTIQQHSRDELLQLLRGTDDLDPDDEERERLDLWATRAWIHNEKVEDFAGFMRQDPTKTSAWRWAQVCFNSQEYWDPLVPFRECVQTLNLLTPSDGPVAVCSIFMRPQAQLQSAKQVESRYLRRIVTGTVRDGNGGYGEMAVLNGCRIRQSDQRSLALLHDQLSRLRSPSAKDSHLDDTHLRIALHFFERADETMAPSPKDFQYIDPLMAYEACLEALLIRENEGDVEKRLRRRVGAVIPAHEGVTEDDIANFVKRVFLLRSKVAHGVWPIETITDYICRRSNEGGKDGRGKTIPEGPYDQMFAHDLPSPTAFCRFLISLREVARRTIRFFLDRHAAGRSRDSVLDELDPPKPPKPSYDEPSAICCKP